MITLSEYFSDKRYKPKWFMGDRVQGKFNNIPYIGTVGNDSLVSEIEGPIVSIYLDLPIKYKKTIYNIIFVKPDTITSRKRIFYKG